MALDASFVWAIALLVVLELSIRRRYARKNGLDAKIMYWTGMWGIVGALWGGHLLRVLATPKMLIEDPLLLFRFLEGGKGVFGAFIGAGLFGWLYLRWKRAPSLSYADAAVPAIALGYAVARIGCFLNGDDFGTLSNLPWAARFTQGTEAYASHLARGWIRVADTLSLPVHPTQLYHAGAGLLLFFVLRSWKGTWPGQRLAMAFIGYGMLRFVIEWFRGDAAAMLGPLHLSHLLSLLFMAAGVSLWWWKGMRRELRSLQHPILAQAEKVLTPIDHDVTHPSLCRGSNKKVEHV